MVSKKKVVKATGKKKQNNVVKTMPAVIKKKAGAKKANKKVSAVSVFSGGTGATKAVLTTTPAKVDTSTPVNKWIGTYDKSIDPYWFLEDYYEGASHPLEHKMFEAAKTSPKTFKAPFWARVLWWFVKK